MTPQKSRELAQEIARIWNGDLHKGRKPRQEVVVEISNLILTSCEAESKLASAAMAEKCIEAMGRADGMVERGRKNAEAIIRSISPAGVLEAHDQAVRLEGVIEGMLQIHNRALHEYGDESTPDCEACSWIQTAKMRLAALRATPQPVAVKENANE